MFSPVFFRKRLLVLGILLIALLVACSGDDDNPDNSSNEDTSLRSFDWDHSPDAILLRFDQIPEGETEAYVTNSVPLCTIWGDGHLVWVNFVGSDAEVLEARLTDDQIRDFVEDIIGFGFYSWEDDVIPPLADNVALQSLVLNLFDNPKTVERYGDWPNNSFEQLITQCRGLSSTPALVVPNGGWVRAYPIEFDSQAIWQEWPRNAPVKMVDVAASDTPTWVEGAWAAELWGYTRTISLVQVTEMGDAFEISMQVPGISRTAPPPPNQ